MGEQNTVDKKRKESSPPSKTKSKNPANPPVPPVSVLFPPGFWLIPEHRQSVGRYQTPRLKNLLSMTSYLTSHAM
ncbi:hypothetical protein CC78DRAFT_93714 [Lojkania enalia]|uniref:Uncharacterized protein n=1 Tax=Lojkania enalia TaxID=147567 RepID=A0A9P4KEK7_9PLEO|nr:hypothetical protein CC78DRAFT_93714 [Didymosphaeria enalia]